MPSRAVRRAWLVGVLVLAMAVSASLQFGLGVLAPFITREFALTPTQFGMAASTLFLTAVLVSLQAGRLISRWGEVRLLRLIFVQAVLALTLIALAPGWTWVLVGAVIMGLPLGLTNPVTNQLIVHRVDRSAQGTVTGIKQSGVQLGALFIGAVLPVVAAAYVWRSAVAVLGGLAMIGLVMSLPLRQHGGGKTVGRAGGGRPSTRAVFLSIYATGMGFGVGAVSAFLPLFSYEELSFSASRAGQLIALIGLLGAVSRVLVGIVLDRVARIENWLAVLSAVAVVSTLALFVTPDRPSVVWLAAIGLGVSATAWQTVVMLAAIREGSDAARASGFVNSGFMVGMMLGPLVFGWLVEQMRSYFVAWGSVVAGFVLALLLSLVAAGPAWRPGSSP